MTTINAIMTALFDLLLRPFASLSPWWGIAVVSALTGLVMLLIFRLTSNQRAISRAKDRIRAHLLEVRLYRDDMRVLLRAQNDILRANLAYLAHSLAPLVVMIGPVLLILAQLNAYYGFRPLRPGESAIVAVQLAPGFDFGHASPRLIVPRGLRVETPPVRIPALREIDWRIGAQRSGIYSLRVVVGSRSVDKQVVVAARRARVTPRRVASNLWDRLLNPGEKPLPAGAGIQSITVGYAPAALPLFRWDVHWLVAFFVLSIAFGFALKGLLRVEV